MEENEEIVRRIRNSLFENRSGLLLLVLIDFLFKLPKWLKEERKGRIGKINNSDDDEVVFHTIFLLLSEFINKHSSFPLALDTTLLRENAFHFHLPQHDVLVFIGESRFFFLSHSELSSSERRRGETR